MSVEAALPGFCAADDGATAGQLRWPAHTGHSSCGSISLWRWGVDVVDDPGVTLLLSKVVRDTNGTVPADRVAALLRSDPARLTRLLPPFAAVGARDDAVSVVADSMGFRPVFHSDGSAGRSSLLTSSGLIAGRLVGAGLDETAVAVQSLLGWQLAQRTLFRGVRKLDPGAVARLDEGGITIDRASEERGDELSLGQAVALAACLLRTSLNALLDDHPDAVLQLTGGMDSRLLLSAIPEKRRRRLRAMTLEVPGSRDAVIARGIAQRYGIVHEVHGLASLADLSPEAAWERCAAESVRLDAMADPVAVAAQRVAEQAFDQGVRISGLGGEVARGFYYVGTVRDRTFTRTNVEQLASWRMFVNDAVEPGLLTSDFAGWARAAAVDEVYDAVAAGGSEWFRAVDHLYLRHRMQRWAGATDTAVSDARVVINPMLDPGFLDIAGRLAPATKVSSRFLAALQMALDPELGRLPLDGRPAPAVYADPPRWQPALDVLSVARRAARKGVQKLARGNRPPAGGPALADKVVEYWRAHPAILEGASRFPFVRADWVDQVVAGQIQPRPSSVAFLTNLVVGAAGAAPPVAR